MKIIRIFKVDLRFEYRILFKVYFRHRSEAKRDDIISARLGSAWRASVLDEENIAVLKQLY